MLRWAFSLSSPGPNHKPEGMKASDCCAPFKGSWQVSGRAGPLDSQLHSVLTWSFPEGPGLLRAHADGCGNGPRLACSPVATQRAKLWAHSSVPRQV